MLGKQGVMFVLFGKQFETPVSASTNGISSERRVFALGERPSDCRKSFGFMERLLTDANL